MGILRAQVVLPYVSGKPEDVAVNTFHFNTGTTSEADKNNAIDQLVEFYTVIPPQGPSNLAQYSIGSLMSNAVSRAAGAAKVRVYDLADVKPRPVYERAFTVPAALYGGAIELPAEVSLVASFYALRNLPRQRGRVYLGPWTVNMTEDDAVNHRARPLIMLREVVQQAMIRLAGKTINVVNWAVYSRITNVAYVVTNGWVDDAWDTQRRRGQDASTRLVWP